MKPGLVTRRRFVLGSLLAAPFLVTADARLLEPEWVKVRRLRPTSRKPTHRLVHFTDVHHKGDRAYLHSVVKRINALSPDLVCFTGDLIEEKQHLPEALEILSGIKSPLYGVPGNHDYWSKAVFADIEKVFAATGGGWLLDRQMVLMHYPAWVKNLGAQQFDLLLAGHSHGGQVRLPLFGPIFIPFGVDQYDLGLFRTACGPLYVNPGIGWFPVPIRFNCRPEITIIEL